MPLVPVEEAKVVRKLRLKLPAVIENIPRMACSNKGCISRSEHLEAGKPAMLAGIGTGVYEGFEDACRKVVRTEACTPPIAANVERYDRLYDVFHGLYPKLKDDFARLDA